LPIRRRNPPPLPAIRLEARELAQRLSAETFGPADAVRAHALSADLAAMVARVDLLTGTRLPFDRESAVFFGLVPPPADLARLTGIRSRIADLVGHAGRLVDRYTMFAARFIVRRIDWPA
jgi:hypothetical protein